MCVHPHNVIAFSKTFEEHTQHVHELHTLLRDAGVALRLKKSEFFKHTVQYLGNKITPGKLGVLEANTHALRDAVFPRTQTKQDSILCMCKVYRRFVKNSASTAGPLTMLTCPALPKNLGGPGP